ncbi:MAG TPA: hypothetical protein VFQ43_21780, partial [Nitrososphaera sp.]|nr:hypothetical protein [Nitrososphaera sp.]
MLLLPIAPDKVPVGADRCRFPERTVGAIVSYRQLVGRLAAAIGSWSHEVSINERSQGFRGRR